MCRRACPGTCSRTTGPQRPGRVRAPGTTWFHGCAPSTPHVRVLCVPSCAARLPAGCQRERERASGTRRGGSDGRWARQRQDTVAGARRGHPLPDTRAVRRHGLRQRRPSAAGGDRRGHRTATLDTEARRRDRVVAGGRRRGGVLHRPVRPSDRGGRGERRGAVEVEIAAVEDVAADGRGRHRVRRTTPPDVGGGRGHRPTAVERPGPRPSHLSESTADGGRRGPVRGRGRARAGAGHRHRRQTMGRLSPRRRSADPGGGRREPVRGQRQGRRRDGRGHGRGTLAAGHRGHGMGDARGGRGHRGRWCPRLVPDRGGRRNGPGTMEAQDPR